MWIPDRQFLAFPPEYGAPCRGPKERVATKYLLSRNFAQLCESDFARSMNIFAFGFLLIDTFSYFAKFSVMFCKTMHF
jgi:hypothetical protein